MLFQENQEKLKRISIIATGIKNIIDYDEEKMKCCNNENDVVQSLFDELE